MYVSEVIPRKVGYQGKLSTAFHSQTDDQAECTIQTLEDMIRSCIISRKIGISISLWWSLLKIIANIHLYLWLLMKPCMVGYVNLQLDGLKWVSIHF